jgi:hypothetical protein
MAEQEPIAADGQHSAICFSTIRVAPMGCPVADTAALRLDDIRQQFKLWLPRRDNRERFGCAGQIK